MDLALIVLLVTIQKEKSKILSPSRRVLMSSVRFHRYGNLMKAPDLGVVNFNFFLFPEEIVYR